MICDISVCMVHQTEGELKATINFEVVECSFFPFFFFFNVQAKHAKKSCHTFSVQSLVTYGISWHQNEFIMLVQIGVLNANLTC